MKYIIFDIDGTLSNTTTVDDKCYLNAFRLAFDVNLDKVNWATITNLTDWGIAEELIQINLKRNPTIEDLNKLEALHIEFLKKEYANDSTQFNEIPGAKNFFDHLSNSKDVTIGIATGAWEESAKIKLNAIGIDPHNICFSNSSHHKTREAIIKDVIKQMKSDYSSLAHEVSYFGDGVWDFKTCKNLGINFIGIDYYGNGKLKKLGTQNVFKDFLNMKLDI